MILTILYLIGYIYTVILTSFTLLHVIRNQQKYITNLLIILTISTLIITGFIYSTLSVFSVILFISESINLLIWKVALIFGFLILGITTFLYVFIKEYKKIPIGPTLFFSGVFGLLIGSLFLPGSITINITDSESPPHLVLDVFKINYYFNTATGIFTILLQISTLFYYIYLSIYLSRVSRNKQIARILLVSTFIFSITIFMYIFYVVFQLSIFRELYILFVWITFTGLCFMLYKTPEIFLVLTNKIYFINIYHKSGVLLYNHKFEKVENEMESAIWGNILIGLNHILSEFIDSKDQIDILQTKNSDIVVDYNNELGFAVLVITNQKNDILKKMMENFMEEFMTRYKDELTEIQDLNKMINVSEFEDTKEIIENNFQLYLN